MNHLFYQSTVMTDEAYDAALDILRRLNPKDIDTNLNNIIKLQPELANDLLSTIDKPLNQMKDSKLNKLFLCCDYNRDGDSFRSPYSNEYFGEEAADEDAPFPSKHLRELEVFANESFDIYRDLYYEGGISNVYLWDKEDEDVGTDGSIPFDGVVLIQKNDNELSTWNSIHVFEIDIIKPGMANYKVTSTILLDLGSNETSFNGNLTRQFEKNVAFVDSISHISNLGRLIEDIEYKLRLSLQEIYFDKSKNILNSIRNVETLQSRTEDIERQTKLINKFNSL